MPLLFFFFCAEWVSFSALITIYSWSDTMPKKRPDSKCSLPSATAVIGVEFGAIDVKQSSLPANLYLNLTFVSAFLFDIIIVLMRGYDEII